MVLSTLIISWILHDIAMLHLELAWIDWYRFSWILRDCGDADFSWIRELFVGIIDGFSRKTEGNSPNTDLRGDYS